MSKSFEQEINDSNHKHNNTKYNHHLSYGSMSGIVLKKRKKFCRHVLTDDTTLKNQSSCKNQDQANRIYRAFHDNRSYQSIGSYFFITGKKRTLHYFTQARNACIHQVTDHDSSK